MKLPRKEVIAKTVKQDNDASCISPWRGHIKRAKRLASKRLRRLVGKEANGTA